MGHQLHTPVPFWQPVSMLPSVLILLCQINIVVVAYWQQVWPSGRGGPMFKSRALGLVGSCGLMVACPASPWYERRRPADCLQGSRGVQVDVRVARVARLHNRDRCPTGRRVSATLQALQLLSAWSARLWRVAGRVWWPAVPQDSEQSSSHTARTPSTAVRNIASLSPQKTHTLSHTTVG